MSSEIVRKDVRVQFRQLEALILVMAGATLASLQIIHYVFFSMSISIAVPQMLLDWLFGMSIIFLLVHFSFREIYKIHNELIVQREQANKAEKRIQHIIDITQDVIFTLDKEGNFTFANKAVENLTGYEISQILRNNIQFILSPEYRTFVPEQLNKYKETSGRHLYIELVKNDGTNVPVELSFIPIKSRNGELNGFQGVARDITVQKDVEKSQKEKERYLKAMARVGQILLESKKEIPYKRILEILTKTSESQNAFILLNKNTAIAPVKLYETNRKAVKNAKNHDMTAPQRLYISYSSNADCKALDAERMAMSLAADDDPCLMGISAKEGTIVSASNGEASTLMLPLMVNSEYAGVIGFDKPVESRGWKPVEINLLATSATMLSQAIERLQASSQLKQHFVQLTRMISHALFAVDPYTVSHQERLASLACLVGDRIGLPDDKLEWLQVGALLHDIGKAAIPNTILSKPGKLTEEEWGLVRSHVKRGYEMLEGMNLPGHVMEMVLNHHERLDGTGYPNNIHGDKLTLESKILEICDVVEAMSSHRPYRPARSKDEILEELRSGREKLYDPRITDLVVEIVEKNEFDFEFPALKKMVALN